MKIQERTGAGHGRSSASAQPAVGERLPAPPRERKPALAALAVLLILIGALGATVLVLRAGDRVEVVQVTSDIPAGSPVTRDKVTSVMVAADNGIHYVKWSQLGALEKLKAKNTLVKGTVVVGEMFAAKSNLPAGKASVGVALKEGQYPPGLKTGDIVAAYRVGNDSSSSSRSGDNAGGGGNGIIVEQARVNSIADKSDATISTGNFSVTLLVDKDSAASLAQAAAAGEVAVVLVPGD